jgi:hypothetical protein
VWWYLFNANFLQLLQPSYYLCKGGFRYSAVFMPEYPGATNAGQTQNPSYIDTFVTDTPAQPYMRTLANDSQASYLCGGGTPNQGRFGELEAPYKGVNMFRNPAASPSAGYNIFGGFTGNTQVVAMACATGTAEVFNDNVYIAVAAADDYMLYGYRMPPIVVNRMQY